MYKPVKSASLTLYPQVLDPETFKYLTLFSLFGKVSFPVNLAHLKLKYLTPCAIAFSRKTLQVLVIFL